MIEADKNKRSATKKKPKVGSTTRSTAGSGFDFEDQIAAWLLLKMLLGEELPSMESYLGEKLQFQTKALGWFIDDLLVTCSSESNKSQLALSCKSNVQVTGVRLPDDFVEDAWKQFTNIDDVPFSQGSDQIALVTRGVHHQFQATWTDIKRECTSSDPALALARILNIDKRRTIFENIKEVVKKSSASVQDQDVLEFVSHLQVIPLDFDLEPSKNLEFAISQCRHVLVSAELNEAHKLWETLKEKAHQARVGNGTIELQHLWNELRDQFELNNHPNFSSGLELLGSYTHEHLNKIETALPSGYSLDRKEEGEKLAKAISENQIVVVYGDSGTGKSAITKSILDTQFDKALHIWLSADTLETTLSEVKRLQTELNYPIDETLKATSNPNNILVIDSAERINSELAIQVKKLIEDIVTEYSSNQHPIWRIIVIGQTDAWVEGRLQILLSSRQPTPIEIEHASPLGVQAALRSIPHLGWLASEDEAVAALTNLRALYWIMQASSQFQHKGINVTYSLTTIADSLWKYWTNGKLELQGILMRLAEREASFEHSIGLSELTVAEAKALDERPPQLPLNITSSNCIEFQHDLASDWARFQHLKQISNDTARWASLAQNPLWTSALRMLGQFLLREQIDNRSAWDIAFEELEKSQQQIGLATDILLDSLYLDPLAESLLVARSDLLFADNAKLLIRLLTRFLHIATVPNSPLPTPESDPSLSLYIEAQFRMPIIGRWPPIIRFLASHCDQVANLMNPIVAKLCERWLTTTPFEVTPGNPVPFRKELAEIALATARALQVAQGKRFIFMSDETEKSIYAAAFAGALDLPDEVAEWALEMAQRKSWNSEVVAKIVEYQKEQSKEHAERLRTDPEYRERHNQRKSFPVHISSARELPPWEHGPKQRVENHFRKCCISSAALKELMMVKPEVAAEVLLAVIIEDSPEEEYIANSRLHDSYGLEYDHHGYPTAFWKSTFYLFLQTSPDIALETLVALVNFCTERWDYEGKRRGYSPAGIELRLSETLTKKYLGNRVVLDWGHDSSMGTGQLHCALAALEKWLCDCLEKNIDVEPYVQYLLNNSQSAAILGTLMNVGKYRPKLFEDKLRSLLAQQKLYFWDENRLINFQFGFDALHWSRQGEIIFQLAKNWWFADYRKIPFRNIARHLVMTNSDIAEYMAEIIKDWKLPEDVKSSLEVQILIAELDRNNYKKIEGENGQMQYEYPASLQKDIMDFNKASESDLRYLTLPHECKQILGNNEVLSKDKIEELVGFLNTNRDDTIPDAEERQLELARITVAATLVSKARSWLDEHSDVHNNVKEILQIAVDQIAEDSEILHNRMLNNNEKLEFVAYAVMHNFINSQDSPNAEQAVLKVLTSGSTVAISTLTSIAYIYRDQLSNNTWWRLIEISILWCALTVLVPRFSEEEELRELWSSWLKRLRSFKLTQTNSDINRITPLAIARRIERLERQRWVREFNSKEEHFRIDPSKRRSYGLDTHFLKATFTWLFQLSEIELDTFNKGEIKTCFELLKRLLEFELWPHVNRQGSDDEDKLPTELGYEITPVMAKLIPKLTLDEAAELWKPLFDIGGTAHYTLDHFISNWMLEAPKNNDVSLFARHWKQMIEYMLASHKKKYGRNWFYYERALCHLMGFNFEASLDQFDELKIIVQQMEDLYKNWAEKHLCRDEDNYSYFFYFLNSSTGSLLRIDALQWIYESIQKEGVDKLYWRRDVTTTNMTDMLDKILVENINEVKANSSARDALLELVAILVKFQAPAALSLQERARANLS